jgi:hypothetical protein
VSAYLAAAVVLPPAATFAAVELDLTALAAAGTQREVESWALMTIPGLTEIELRMDRAMAKEFVYVVADLARRYRLEVRYLLPGDRWREVTGQEPRRSTFFASGQGIAYAPEDWAPGATAGISQLGRVPFAQPGWESFRAVVAHEVGHVATLRPSLWSQARGQPEVEAYRRALGREGVIAELGWYAWHGDSTEPEEAWKETLAQAFAACYLRPDGVRPETRELVRGAFGE